MRFLWPARIGIVLGIVIGCGARTEIGGVIPGSDAAPLVCSKPAWIVFDKYDAKQAGIAAMRLDGTSFHMLDLGGDHGWTPSISPDGASLLYVASVGDADESLVLLDLASKNKRTIAHITVQPPSAGLEKAAVSPDNKLIAFGLSPDLHLASFDGGNDHVIVSGPYNAGCCPWSYGHPEFSPDSSLIYFSTIGRLESIHADGTSRQLLEQDQFFPNVTISGFSFPNLSLSPDGTRFVAEVACDVSELRIFTVGELPGDPCKLGTKLVELHTPQAANEAANPSWGPDGIVYDDDKDLFVIDPSGGTPKNITQGITTTQAAVAADPVWASGCANIP